MALDRGIVVSGGGKVGGNVLALLKSAIKTRKLNFHDEITTFIIV